MCVCLGVGEAAVAVGLFAFLSAKWRAWRKRSRMKVVDAIIRDVRKHSE